MARPKLTDVEGIGPVAARNLRRAGIRSVEALADATMPEIEAVPGLGHASATTAARSARALVGTSRPRVAPRRPAGAPAPGPGGSGSEPGKGKGKKGDTKDKGKKQKKKGKKGKKGKSKKGKKGKKGKKSKKKGG